MTEQSTARIALRLVLRTFVPTDTLLDALELVEVLYAPFQKAEVYLSPASGTSGHEPQYPMPSPQVIQDADNLRKLIGETSPLLAPKPQDIQVRQESGWLPVFHTKGDQPCNQPAYWVTNKLHPRKKPSPNVIRLISTNMPPRPGVDRQVCGSCNYTLVPFFSRDDLELDAVMMTPAEIHLEEARTQSIDPELEKLNMQSRRWDAASAQISAINLDPATEGLIGLAVDGQTPETMLQHLTIGDPFAGLPPDDPTPKLEDLPDPRNMPETDIPAPSL